MNDNTKHYTHPALGINVYKDNLGYFAKMEKEAQAKLKKQKIKDFFFDPKLILILTVFNLWFWAALYHFFK